MNALEELEMRLTSVRMIELWFRPLPERFDAEALREMHTYIFQDLPKAGIHNPPPGEFRHETPTMQGDWSKNRTLESLDDRQSFVCYSPMASTDTIAIDVALADTQPAHLKNLSVRAFADKMSALYGTLDYIHPFYEGNSRTLRAFTERLARASGYDLNWERFNTPRLRDLLYIARDRAVGELALDKIRLLDNARRVAYYMDLYGPNPSLTALLQNAVRPLRALVFEKSPPQQAIVQHPELAEAFKALALAKQYFEKRQPSDTAAQASAMTLTRQYIQAALNRGLTSGFHRPEKKQD